MGTTPNIGLHQWAGTDPFLRKEFNEDFRRIDGAVGEASRIVKLMDITTRAGAQQVDIDLSKIEWVHYTEVVIYSWFESEQPGYGIVRFNNYAAQQGYDVVYNGSYAAETYAGRIAVDSVGVPAQNQHHIPCLSGKVLLHSCCSVGNGVYTGFGGYKDDTKRSLSQQQTLNFCAEEGQTLLAGAKILIYGVRR